MKAKETRFPECAVCRRVIRPGRLIRRIPGGRTICGPCGGLTPEEEEALLLEAMKDPRAAAILKANGVTR